MEVCADIGSQGATCDHFLTDQPRDIKKSRWDDERFGMLCITPDAWADIKRELEQLCSVSKQCDYAKKENISVYTGRIDKLVP